MSTNQKTRTAAAVLSGACARPLDGGLGAGWQGFAVTGLSSVDYGMTVAYATEPFTAGTFAAIPVMSLAAGVSVKQAVAPAAAHAAKRNDATPIGTSAGAPPG